MLDRHALRYLRINFWVTNSRYYLAKTGARLLLQADTGHFYCKIKLVEDKILPGYLSTESRVKIRRFMKINLIRARARNKRNWFSIRTRRYVNAPTRRGVFEETYDESASGVRKKFLVHFRQLRDSRKLSEFDLQGRKRFSFQTSKFLCSCKVNGTALISN